MKRTARPWISRGALDAGLASLVVQGDEYARDIEDLPLRLRVRPPTEDLDLDREARRPPSDDFAPEADEVAQIDLVLEVDLVEGLRDHELILRNARRVDVARIVDPAHHVPAPEDAGVSRVLHEAQAARDEFEAVRIEHALA